VVAYYTPRLRNTRRSAFVSQMGGYADPSPFVAVKVSAPRDA